MSFYCEVLPSTHYLPQKCLINSLFSITEAIITSIQIRYFPLKISLQSMSLERCCHAFVNNERQQRNACNNHNTLIPSILGFSVFITIIYYLFPHSVFFSPLHRNLLNISKIFCLWTWSFDRFKYKQAIIWYLFDILRCNAFSCGIIYTVSSYLIIDINLSENNITCRSKHNL